MVQRAIRFPNAGGLTMRSSGATKRRFAAAMFWLGFAWLAGCEIFAMFVAEPLRWAGQKMIDAGLWIWPVTIVAVLAVAVIVGFVRFVRLLNGR
jgi:hypothetical protein